MTAAGEAQAKAAATYNAAADTYDHAANSFWERYGRRTVERLGLRPGQHVLDVCCGSGASALPAAHAVGPDGRVLGIDLAENLLALARSKAERAGLRHVEFRRGDLLATGLPDAGFDAVVCVFGIFFVPEMDGAVRELWRLVRPGGRLAVTTWGPRFFEPLNGAFWSAVREVEPALYKSFNPWERIAEPEALRALLASAGVAAAEVTAEAGSQAVPSPAAWWAMVLGTGYRGTIEQLDEASRERVRNVCATFLQDRAVTTVEANVVYAVAAKP